VEDMGVCGKEGKRGGAATPRQHTHQRRQHEVNDEEDLDRPHRGLDVDRLASRLDRGLNRGPVPCAVATRDAAWSEACS
jgi:hypothetical protein